MPSLPSNVLDFPGALVPQNSGEGVARFKDLDFSEELITADQTLLIARLLAAGFNPITNLTHAMAGDPLTITKLDGTTSTLSVTGTTPTPTQTTTLYSGYTAMSVGTADLTDAILTGSQFASTTNVVGDIAVTIDPTDDTLDLWTAWLLVTSPATISYINEGIGSQSTLNNWTNATVTIGSNTYDVRYFDRVSAGGSFSLTVRVTT